MMNGQDFKPTWLYIKQHNTTGLKYFGKTTNPDPHKYSGSGQYRRDHLNKHGKNITTIWCQLFNEKAALTEFAQRFSIENNIVESKEWANLIPETGYDDGGNVKGRRGKKHSEETKAKIRKSRQLQLPTMLGKHHSDETKEKIRQARSRQVISEETKIKISLSNKGRKFSNERNKKISIALTGLKRSDETKLKLSESAKIRKRMPHSEETKAKISHAAKNRWKNNKGVQP